MEPKEAKETEVMSAENETIADIVAEMRGNEFDDPHLNAEGIIGARRLAKGWADRIEAAWKREQELLRSCARWINTHDIYSNMAKELLAECKEVLHDDGNFLMPKGEIV